MFHLCCVCSLTLVFLINIADGILSIQLVKFMEFLQIIIPNSFF